MKTFRTALLVCLALVFCITGAPRISPSGITLSVSEAQAQAAPKKKRRSLFTILFGREKAKTKAVRKKRAVKPRRKTRRTKESKKSTRVATRSKKKSKSAVKRRVRVAKVPLPAALEKSEDAKKVLVVGDFFGIAMAKGLAQAYTEEPGLVVVDRSQANTGFVRDDIVNWPIALPEIVEAEKPDYIIAMVGSNDRQPMRDGGRKLKKRSEEWDKAYTKRVEAFGASLKATGLPYSWVGLPPVRFKNMNRDFLIFNELYRKASVSDRGEFIDVWDGFSDADGNYTRSGPDVNGQIVLLRPKDGVNMTRAGRERLAFYLQGKVKKVLSSGLGVAAIDFDLNINGRSPQEAVYDPAKTGKTIVIRLNDPTIDGIDTLAGEQVNLNGGVGTTFAVPVINPAAPTVRKEGRIDNYAWPPVNPAGATTPTVAASAN